MKNKASATIFLMAIAFVSGCAVTTTQVVPEAGSLKPENDSALIVIKRPPQSLFGSRRNLKVYGDDKLIGSLAAGGQLAWKCSPGTLKIRVADECEQLFVDQVAAGKTMSYTVSNQIHTVVPFMQFIYVTRDDYDYGRKPSIDDISKMIHECDQIRKIYDASLSVAKEAMTGTFKVDGKEIVLKPGDSGIIEGKPALSLKNIQTHEKGPLSGLQYLYTTRIYDGNRGHSGWLAFCSWEHFVRYRIKHDDAGLQPLFQGDVGFPSIVACIIRDGRIVHTLDAMNLQEVGLR